MSPGSVIEYLEGKDLALAFCLAAETKGKLPILTSTGRKETLAAKKVLFSHPSALSPNASREEVLDLLRAAEKQREDGSEALDLEELWELVIDEGDEKDWSLQELTALLFSDQQGELQKSLAFRALNEGRTYFWRKADNFRIRTREQVEEALTRQRTEAKRELERAALRDWLIKVWDDGPTDPPEEYRAYIEDWINKIRDSAIWGEKSSHHGHVQRLLKDFDSKGNEPAFHFMVRLGEWSNDQNIDLFLNETLIEFPQQVLDAARELEKLLPSVLAEEDREDLTDWPCYSIDDPDTTEVDDALGYREVEGGFELAIHIADASALLPASVTVMEEEIRERATSVYLPDLKIRMVPGILSDHALSLIEGEERPAFSFLVKVDPEGRLLESRIATTRMKVAKRYDYETVDKLVAEGDSYWVALAGLAEKLKALREEKGALNLPFPRMDVRLDPDGKVTLVPDERESIAQTIVSEAMIMANRVAADYTATHNLPAIYRGQKAPEPPVEPRAQWLPHHLFDVRKGFARSTQSLEPHPHAGLGLDRYIQATSPIRRYRDLIHQRQIKHHLKTGTLMYDSKAMEEILTHTSTPVSAAEKMERNRRAYFLHKFLKGQRGNELEAVILASTTERYMLQLCHSLREIEVPHGSGGLKAPGEIVKVKLLSVFPRDRVIKVSSPL